MWGRPTRPRRKKTIISRVSIIFLFVFLLLVSKPLKSYISVKPNENSTTKIAMKSTILVNSFDVHHYNFLPRTFCPIPCQYFVLTPLRRVRRSLVCQRSQFYLQCVRKYSRLTIIVINLEEIINKDKRKRKSFRVLPTKYSRTFSFFF